MIKRIAVIGCILFAVIFCSLIIILNNAFLTQSLAGFFIQKTLPKNLTLKKLQIAQQNFHFPGQLILSNVTAECNAPEGAIQVKVDELKVDFLERIFYSPLPIEISVNQLEASTPVVTMASVNGKMEVLFPLGVLKSWDGQFQIKQVKLKNYALTNVNVIAQGNRMAFDLNEITAEFYEGQIRATAAVQLNNPPEYQIQMDLKAVNINAMRFSDETIYKNIQGVVDLTMHASGAGETLTSLNIQGNILKEGQIRASLLSFVVPYIPPTNDIKAFQELIKNDAKVPVEKAKLQLSSVSQDKLSGEINLGIRKINLNLNLPIDILFDGNYMMLIKKYQEISN